MDKIREFIEGVNEAPVEGTGKLFEKANETEDEIEIKILDEDRFEHLLMTNDPRDRVEIIEAIDEFATIMFEPLPEGMKAGMIKYATLPAVQMLFYGMTMKEELAIDLARAMIAMDFGTDMVEKMDKDPDYYKEKGDEISKELFPKEMLKHL